MIKTGYYYVWKHGDGKDRPVWFERTLCEKVDGTFCECFIMRSVTPNTQYPRLALREEYILEHYREYNP